MSTTDAGSSAPVMARQTSVAGNRSRLMKACRQVEGLFLSRMLEAMDRPAFGGGVLGNSNAGAVFRTQRNQAIADEMSLRGELGLADMLYQDLTNHAAAPDAPPDAAGSARGADSR